MALNTDNLIALGKDAYLARTAIRGGKDTLAQELGFGSGGSMKNAADNLWFPENIAPTRQRKNGNGNGNNGATVTNTAIVNGYWSLPLVKALRDWSELREIESPNFDEKQSVVTFLQSWALNAAFNRFMTEKQRDGFSHELANAGVKTASMIETETKAKEALKVSVQQAMLLLEGQGYVVLTGLDELPLVSDLDAAFDSENYKLAQALWLRLEALETKHARASKLMERLDLRAMESVEVREGYQSLVDALREKACAKEIAMDTPPADQAAIDAAELEAFRAWKASQA